jgi:hypothetical protein
MFVGVAAAAEKKKREMNVTLNKLWDLPRPIMLTKLLNHPYVHTKLVNVNTCNCCVWNVMFWTKELTVFGGRGLLFIIFVGLGIKCKPLIFGQCSYCNCHFPKFIFCPHSPFRNDGSTWYNHHLSIKAQMKKDKRVHMPPKDLFSCTIQRVCGSSAVLISW